LEPERARERERRGEEEEEENKLKKKTDIRQIILSVAIEIGYLKRMLVEDW
jgi:hypothetical protein